MATTSDISNGICIEFNGELERSKSIINCVLKASIARYLYGVSGYYYNIYEIDYELKKAVELGKDGKVFEQLY
jgi:hypothetical protein